MTWYPDPGSCEVHGTGGSLSERVVRPQRIWIRRMGDRGSLLPQGRCRICNVFPRAVTMSPWGTPVQKCISLFRC